MTTCLTFCSSGLSKDLRTLLINWPTESIAANGQKSSFEQQRFSLKCFFSFLPEVLTDPKMIEMAKSYLRKYFSSSQKMFSPGY